MTFSRNTKRGFTLVELLVAIAVFMVVITFSLGSVLSILNAGNKAKSLNSVMTNLNFAVELMSREIKFGTHYHCVLPSEVVVFPPVPQDCTGSSVQPQPAFAFVTSDGVYTEYRLQNIQVGGQTVGQIQKSTNGGVSYVGVTAPEVNIQSMLFYVFGSHPKSDPSSPDNIQPRALLVIRGYAGNKPSTHSSFVLQTSFSQRILDENSVIISNPGGGGSSGPTQAVYQYIKFRVTSTFSEPTQGCIQYSELTLTLNGSPVSWPVGASATNPGGSNFGGEGPSNTIDGNLLDKLCDLNGAGGNTSTLIINAGSPVTFDGYKYATGNDSADRDPVTWTLEGSNDGSTWKVLDTRTNQSDPVIGNNNPSPNGRNTYTGIFTVTP